MKKVRLAIIVPTRNRAELAITTVNSILSFYPGDDVKIFISDNSTDVAESSLLDEYASRVDQRVKLIRPKVSSGMTAHWNFAVEHAASELEFTHFTVLTDRMLFKAGSINEIMAVLELFPTDLVSYTYDRILDLSLPAIFTPLPRSGKLIRIPTAKMLAMSSEMEFPSCLPRMLNSVCTREHLLELKVRSGQIFSSISPDFNFCYRTLEICRSFLFYDKSMMVNYAQGRSNGASFSRGVMTKDSRDFIEQLGISDMNGCSPLPEISTVGNSIVHEYYAERKLSGSGNFPDVSIDVYMNFLAVEILRFEDPAARRRSLCVLREHGWKPTLRFHRTRWKVDLTGWLLSLRSRKFHTVNEAISYACAHRKMSASWLPHPSHNYGVEVRACVRRKEPIRVVRP